MYDADESSFAGFPQAGLGAQQCLPPSSMPAPCQVRASFWTAGSIVKTWLITYSVLSQNTCARPAATSATNPTPSATTKAPAIQPCPVAAVPSSAASSSMEATHTAVNLDDCPHECDAIDMLLADVDLFPASKVNTRPLHHISLPTLHDSIPLVACAVHPRPHLK
jgi:hypothetical protein